MEAPSHRLEGPELAPRQGSSWLFPALLGGQSGKPPKPPGLLSQPLCGHCPTLCRLSKSLLWHVLCGLGGRALLPIWETRPHSTVLGAATVGGGMDGPVPGCLRQDVSLAEATSSVGQCGLRPEALSNSLGRQCLVDDQAHG